MQNCDANSMNVKEVRTNEHTNGRTDQRKEENYIPVGINAGGIKTKVTVQLINVLVFAT